MIVTFIKFPENDSVTPIELDHALKLFSTNAASYLQVPGLLWKAYLVAEDKASCAGVYWWADRASAQAKLNPEWEKGVTEKYGSKPQVEYYDAPVIVDNRFSMVRTQAPPMTVNDSS